jgi:hypothetical protein
MSNGSKKRAGRNPIDCRRLCCLLGEQALKAYPTQKLPQGKKEKSPDEPFSARRLMADLGMTAAEIFAASFASRHIARGVRRGGYTGFAAEVLFQYRENQQSAQERTSSNPDLIVSQDGLCDLDERAQFRRK